MLHTLKRQLTNVPFYMFSTGVNCDIAIIGGGPGGNSISLLNIKRLCCCIKGRTTWFQDCLH